MLNVFGAITVDQPGLLLLLAVLAPLAALLVYAARRARRDLRALRRVASLPAAAPSPDAVLRFKRGADGALTWVAVACVILGAADLRWGPGPPAPVPPPGGREVVLLVDLSRSMAVADVAPSRLRQGLTAAGELVAALPDAPVAVVGFSDDSHLLLPFTDDRFALRQQLAALHDQAPALGGSQLAAALRYASFELPGRTGAARTVVLVSDGESSAGDPRAVARQAGRGGVAIVAVPVGTAAGAPVPAGGGATARPARPAGQAEGTAPAERGAPGEDVPGGEGARVGQDGAAGSPATGEHSASDGSAMREIAQLSGGVVADPRLPETMATAHAYLEAARDGHAVRRAATRRPRHAALALIALAALAGCAAVRAVRWRATF